jgi:hypothetical protein
MGEQGSLEVMEVQAILVVLVVLEVRRALEVQVTQEGL